ncbi:manganese/iron transport system ATP-binding protein [Arcanobacterium wilhelmae]|uniref:Manganese/iron transport system ATP-binding protein n=1 Tax=Arcanobacterium wilhelmae TaxID=1803177 RepID=A0ABT9N9Z0_9ACTO|nr:manganese/iron transport system ATP-binding protein [Arcanobacterium wilhelmae]
MSLPALKVEGLNVTLTGRSILENIGFEVAKGELAGLIGPNGAGKTTLMRAIMGLIRSQGIVETSGKIGYVPQRQDVDWAYPMSVETLVRTTFVGRAHKVSRREGLALAYQALKKVGMYELRERTIDELSGGQKQRILIARALAPNPDILLLDEPFTGLDHPNQDLLSDLFVELARGGVGILMSTHDLTQAVDICDSLVMINRTVRAAGKPADLMEPQLWIDTYQVRENSALLRSLGMVNA